MSLVSQNLPQANEELEKLKIVKGTNEISAWDRYYYAKSIEPLLGKPSTLPNTFSGVSSYFTIGNVFQGISDTLFSLYGVRLEPQDTIPGEIWHPDVKKFSVIHESEGLLGTIYCDLFKRDNEWEKKYESPAHFTVRCCRRVDDDEPFLQEQALFNTNHLKTVVKDGVKKTYQLPVVVLVTAFSSPNNGIPCLLDLKDISALFHEMGHAMHCNYDY